MERPLRAELDTRNPATIPELYATERCAHHAHTMGAIMNQELKSRLLSELGKLGLPWESGENHDAQGQGTVKWLPIANLTQARVQLGVSSDGFWVRSTPQSIVVFSSETTCVFLLPILEVALDEARRRLEFGLQENGLSALFLNAFPFEDVVATGLGSHSEHWTSLALRWAEQLPKSSKLQHALQTLKANGPTQNIRHAAQKLLARQEKSDNEGKQI